MQSVLQGVASINSARLDPKPSNTLQYFNQKHAISFFHGNTIAKHSTSHSYSLRIFSTTFSSEQNDKTHLQEDGKSKQFQAIPTPSSFSFKAYVQEKIDAVNKAVDEAVAVKEPKELYESMRYTLFGGKKIFPMLCIAVCELVGGQQSRVMPAACAAEMIHAMSLIEDDHPSCDNDDIRRGIPSNHKIYGDNVALLAGSTLCAFAFKHMAAATKGVPPERLAWAISELAKATEAMQAGQVADAVSMGMSSINNATLQQMDFIAHAKTGALFTGSVVVGAIIGGATDEQVETLSRYGRTIGLLYQHVDDLEDVTKDSTTDQLTYPKLIGFEKTKERAEMLDMEANDYLAGFDPNKVTPLLHLKSYMLHREKYLETCG